MESGGLLTMHLDLDPPDVVRCVCPRDCMTDTMATPCNRYVSFPCVHSFGNDSQETF